MSKDTRISEGSGQLHMFSGFMVCGGCGRTMVIRTVKKNGKAYVNFTCSTHKKDGTCKSNNISARAIEKFVLLSIQAHVASLLSAADMDDFGTDSLQSRKQLAIEKMIEQNMRIIQDNQGYLVKSYEHFVDGSISEDEYIMFKGSFNKQIQVSESNISALQVELSKLKDGVRSIELIERFRQYNNITELSRAVIVNLIQSIIVYDNKELEICFRYMSEYDTVNAYQVAEKAVM